MDAACNRIIIYTRKVAEMAEFYSTYFGYEVIRDPKDRLTELRRNSGGLTLLLHPAGKGQRQGQSQVKLVFDTPDVDATRTELMHNGVDVGPMHHGDGYVFANLKDPAGNSLSISSRAFGLS